MLTGSNEFGVVQDAGLVGVGAKVVDFVRGRRPFACDPFVAVGSCGDEAFSRVFRVRALGESRRAGDQRPSFEGRPQASSLYWLGGGQLEEVQ